MQKDHVKYLRINIWPFQVYLSLGIIQNFCKNRKKVKKKSSKFSKIKILSCNSYPRITKKLIFFENSNFSSTKNDKLMISALFSTVLNMKPYFSETIFSRGFWDMSHLLPLAPPKKFILLSKFDQKNQKFITKSSFLWLKTLQFQLHCFSGI